MSKKDINQGSGKDKRKGGSNIGRDVRRAADKARRGKPARPARPSGAKRSSSDDKEKPARPGRRKPTQAKRPARPRVRRAGGAAAVGSAASRGGGEPSQERQSDINRLKREFGSLQGEAQFSRVYEDMGEIDTRFSEFPLELDGLRNRGYVHSRQLEDKIKALEKQWRTTRPGVESTLEQKIKQLRFKVQDCERKVARLSVRNSATITAAEAAINGLETQVRSSKSAISGLYDDLERELNEIAGDFRRVDKMLDLIDDSSEVSLRPAEGPIAVTEAEWQRDGDEGPDGYLYLTDQRLLFEQKEEVVTKKRFGLFASAKETIQRLLLDVPTHELEDIKHKEEGGFLGMGKDDILELIFGASAPVTRARFHIKGQESSDWAVLLRRAQSRELDQDRAVAYAEDVVDAQALSQSFPAMCHSCFAAVEPPPPGVMSLTCEFCGAVIKPEMPATE